MKNPQNLKLMRSHSPFTSPAGWPKGVSLPAEMTASTGFTTTRNFSAVDVVEP